MPHNGQLKVWNCPLCQNNNGLHHSYVLSWFIEHATGYRVHLKIIVTR